MSFNDKGGVAGISAWYLPDNDDIVKDSPGMSHETKNKVTLEYLNSLGVLSTNINANNNWKDDNKLTNIRNTRGYHSFDQVDCSNLSNEIKDKFFTEHLHIDEEIRLILTGKGYFDIRDKNDKWIRICVTSGVLVIFPAGIWHRFAVSDDDNNLKAVRLFTTEPKWTAYNRHDNTIMDNNNVKTIYNSYINNYH